jgi:hypothetical protein
MSELITTQVVSFYLFGGSYIKSLNYMIDNKLIPYVTESCFSKCIKKHECVIDFIFNAISISKSIDNQYVTDSFPLDMCKKYRKNKIFNKNGDCGYNASKQCYFLGVKVLLINNLDGIIIDYVISKASTHDLNILKTSNLDMIPKNSQLKRVGVSGDAFAWQAWESMPILIWHPYSRKHQRWSRLLLKYLTTHSNCERILNKKQ